MRVGGGESDEPHLDDEGRAFLTSDQSASNELSGVVHGPAIQARSISGGVHFTVTQAGQPDLPVPAQLPPAASHFTGRAEELAELDRVAAEYDPARRLTVAVIIGVGGAGKSSLASHWLHLVSERYEGGALYADLRGHAPDAARQPDEVLTGFLAALGAPPERIPLGLDEQAALFRSLTSGRRMLVLLDDAVSAAQVRAMLPGPGPRRAPDETGLSSLVVVTTRWRITGLAMDGARFLELGPLNDVSAAALLGKVIGVQRAMAETEATRSVVRMCGGLPLAVRIAAAQLASHVLWPVGRMAADLASDQHRLAALTIDGDISVRAAFDVSYRALPPEAARLYRLASVITGPDFGAELAAATADLSHERGASLLEVLTGASLLQETPEQRFRLHDLVRLHARDHVQAHERTEAVTRAVGWHLARAVTADVMIMPGRWRLNPMYERARASPPAFGGPPEALRWMESELPGLMAALETANSEGLHEQAWQMCEAMWGLFTYRKYFQYWIQAHRAGLASAQACGDRRAESRMRVQLGLAYLYLGRNEQAREEFVLALALARQERHLIGEATAWEHLGLVDLSLGQPEQAIDAFTRARETFQEIGRPRGVMLMTRRMGEAHRDAGRHGQAVQNLLDARRMAAELADPYNEARSLTGLGQAYLIVSQPEPALRSLTEALSIMVRIGGQGGYDQARIQALLAEAHLGLGRTGQAREYLTGALAVYTEIDAPEAEQIRCRLAELGAGSAS